MSFKSSALFLYLLCLKCWGLDWLVRSHRKEKYGCHSRLDLGRDNLNFLSFVGPIQIIFRVLTRVFGIFFLFLGDIFLFHD